MTSIFLLAALAVTGLGGWMGRRWPLLGKTMMCLGGLGLAGVIALQFRQNVLPSSPDASTRYRMAASYGLASCLLDDLAGPDDRSGKVVLLFPQRSDMDEDSEKSYEDGFILPLRHGRMKLNLKAVHLEGSKRDISVFKQALAQTPETMAVISYAGVPDSFEALFPAGQQENPLFYVFDGDGTANWLDPLKNGRIKAVVVPRPGTDIATEGGITGMPETVFDRFYLLATPENADEVAATLKTRQKPQH